MKRLTSDIKLLFKLSASVVLYYSGVLRLIRRINKKNGKNSGIKILTYHEIGDRSYLNMQMPEKIFLSHIEYLIENKYNIIDLEQGVELLRTPNGPIPEDTVAITFDDGHKSIYKSILPIVKEHKIPVTVFISTEPVEKKYPLFVDALSYAFEKTEAEKLDLTDHGLREYPIKTHQMKETAGHEINTLSKNLVYEDRKKLIECIFERLGVDLGSDNLKLRMLTWSEISEMSEQGMQFGAHTVTHPCLSRIPPEIARDEVIRSKRILEKKLKRKIKTFAYPYGSLNDIDEGVRKAVAECGFSCACTLKDGINGYGDDLFMLKRTCVTNQISHRFLWPFSKALFAAEMSGVFDPLRKQQGRHS